MVLKNEICEKIGVRKRIVLGDVGRQYWNAATDNTKSIKPEFGLDSIIKMTWIGVDIGGSHISAAQVLWDGKDVHVGTICDADVNTYRSANEIIADWTAVIGNAMGKLTDCKIGIAMPGPFDYPNGISLVRDQGKMRSLYGLSVKKLLSESLTISYENIAFTNDAEAFLLGESLVGAGRNYENSLGLTLGTGLGSAFKIGHEIKDAKLWTAAFQDGIAEDYLGTNWFKKYAFEKHGLSISGVKDLLSEDINSAIADQIFIEFGYTLGEFLSPYVIRLQCQGVVLGGKIARAADRFLPQTQAYLKKSHCSVEITISVLEDRAALIGACIPFISENKPPFA
ncbi:ROK family protein [Algoriphagus sp.]|uniref:ROK family protein n=1 Tax=Algoriphagus sp. TaxID=1872435 RepID=UPI003919A3F7